MFSILLAILSDLAPFSDQDERHVRAQVLSEAVILPLVQLAVEPCDLDQLMMVERYLVGRLLMDDDLRFSVIRSLNPWPVILRSWR